MVALSRSRFMPQRSGVVQRSPMIAALLNRPPPPIQAGLLGGLARAGRGLLAGYLAREDQNQRNAAMQALAQGLGPQMAAPPAGSTAAAASPGGFFGGGIGMGQGTVAPPAPQTAPGTLATAMGALTAPELQNNPYASQLAGQLGLQQAANQAAQQLAATKAATAQQNAMQLAAYKNQLARQPGQFQGTGIVAQSYNVLMDPNADPSSPQYAAAWAELSRPQVQIDQVTGNLITTRRDLSRFTPPTTAAPPQPERQQAEASAQQPASGVTVQPLRAPKMSESETKSAGFADRMFEADQVLEEVAGEGSSLIGRMLEGVPLGNLVQDPSYQRFEQARRDFLNAVLRRESGAVISDAEFANADKQYFPVPGDSKKVIEQKRRNRATALRGIARSAGQGYEAPWNMSKQEIADIRKKLKDGTASVEEVQRLELYARYQ